MSIKFQRIIKYIPILNLTTFFFWMVASRNNYYSTWDSLKTYFRVFLYTFTTWGIMQALLFVIPNEVIDNIVLYIGIYLCTLALSWVLVDDQEKMLAKAQDSSQTNSNPNQNQTPKKALIPLKVQKILMFIPLANIVTIISGAIFISRWVVSFAEKAKIFIKLFISVVIIVGLRFLSIYFVNDPILNTVCLCVMVYLIFCAMSLVFVSAQEKILSKEDKAS